MDLTEQLIKLEYMQLLAEQHGRNSVNSSSLPPFYDSPNLNHQMAFLKSQRRLKINLKWIFYFCFEKAVVLLNKHFSAYFDCWLMGFYILKKRETTHSCQNTN